MCMYVCDRAHTKAKHRHDRTQGTTHDANGDEIHHGTGDVLLMVTVGDPGWAGCTMWSHRCGPRFRPLLFLFHLCCSSPFLISLFLFLFLYNAVFRLLLPILTITVCGHAV